MQYLKTLFEAQKKLKSSDLHLYETHPPYLRGADGGLYPVKNYSALTSEDMEHIMKSILSDRQIEIFQEKKDFELSARLEGVARFRVNFYHEFNGIAIVFRMLTDEIESLADLGIPKSVEDLTFEHYGFILVTGPNGSGKSTTMSAMLNAMNKNRNVNIITIEDPIEIVHESKKSVVSQREVGTHIASFKEAAKYLFRQDVNVVIIGELRDYESFALAIDIAETGHLVMSTVHSEDVGSTISRIVNIFPSDQQNMIRMKLALSLKGIVSQKLIPRKDFTGRVVATEVCLHSPTLRQLILDRKENQILQFMESNRDVGMQTFNDHILEHYANGSISRDQALLNSHNPEDFIALLDEVDEGIKILNQEAGK